VICFDMVAIFCKYTLLKRRLAKFLRLKVLKKGT